MVYIVIILLTILGVFIFDFSNKEKNKIRDRYYFALCILLTAVSAFQYRIGADMPAYMGEYWQYGSGISWAHISSYSSRRPGWALLNIICNGISNDFVVLKSVIAIFVNGIIFRFFKKYCNYLFLCLLLYFISLYLPLNFNILRASIPIALFIYSLEALINKHFMKYYVLVAISLLFHESAIFLIIIPLMLVLKIKYMENILN